MPDLPVEWRSPRGLLALALVAIVLASTWTMLGNGWVQDDLPIVLTNATVHSLGSPWRFFLTSYWPDPFPRELYRPLTLMLLAVEWAVGRGGPLAFRIASILLYAATVFAVWRLARRLLPTAAAFVAAALFAAHPVHVEAVAVAVSQAELAVALLLTLAITAWIDRRREALPVTGRWAAGLGATFFVAMLFKEHAVVLPALIVAAEVTVLARPGIPRLNRTDWRRLLIGCLFLVVLIVFVRDLVLSGDTKGTFTAEALVDQDMGGRLLTMLGVVPEWGRLLAWPAHLRADYSPQVIVPATRFGLPQGLGLLLVLVAIGLFLHQRTRARPVAFGLAWLAIALGPVHNVLVPTGIVLAERTLFFPSIGFVLAGVALLDGARRRLAARQATPVNGLATAAVAALLVMGITRSASRQRVWHDLPTLWHQTLIDAPNSYRAHHAFAQVLFKAGDKADAEWHYHRAMALYPGAWPLYLDLADKYRLDGQCWPAIKLYRLLLQLNPYHGAGRGSLVACLVYVGMYQDAAKVAREGVEYQIEEELLTKYAATADSAERVGAPAGTVRLSAPPPDPVVP